MCEPLKENSILPNSLEKYTVKRTVDKHEHSIEKKEALYLRLRNVSQRYPDNLPKV